MPRWRVPEFEFDAPTLADAKPVAGRTARQTVEQVPSEPPPPPPPGEEYSADDQPGPVEFQYGPHSFFARPIDDYAPGIPADVDSRQKCVQSFRARPVLYDNVDVNWGIPYYYGRARDPLYTIRHVADTPADTKNYGQDAEGKRVHAPAGFEIAASGGGSGDQNVNIVDQVPDAQGKRWYYVIRIGDTGGVDHANRVIRCYRCIRFELGGSGFRFVNEPPPVHRPIRACELLVPGGNIGHMMEIDFNCLTPGPVGWYAQSDGKGHKGSCDGVADNRLPRFGDVFRLRISDEEVARRPPWGQNLLRGLRDYGAVVARNGGAVWTLKFESSLGYPSSPWTGSIDLPLRYGELLTLSEWQNKMEIVRASALPPRN